MKATGIVRRIDELGRVVIPKEIRRTLRIREGDPLEIFTDRDGEVILKKYSPIGELSAAAKEYADALQQALGHTALICDKDVIVAASGSRKEYADKMISKEIETAIQERKHLMHIKGETRMIPITKGEENYESYTCQIIAPIISDSEPIGAVMLVSKQADEHMSETEMKVAQTTASLIGRQMES
ncbi:MAG: stage V sporulation protein T [Christensenellales bacterium]